MGLSSISDVVFNADTDREKNHQNDTADREQCVAYEGYENFQLKNCAVKASFSGKIDVKPFFWKYPQKIQYRFHTEYAY